MFSFAVLGLILSCFFLLHCLIDFCVWIKLHGYAQRMQSLRLIIARCVYCWKTHTVIIHFSLVLCSSFSRFSTFAIRPQLSINNEIWCKIHHYYRGIFFSSCNWHRLYLQLDEIEYQHRQNNNAVANNSNNNNNHSRNMPANARRRSYHQIQTYTLQFYINKRWHNIIDIFVSNLAHKKAPNDHWHEWVKVMINKHYTWMNVI